MGNIRYPFGVVGTTATLTATGAQAVTVDSQFMVIDGETTEATGNRTVNLTIDSNVTIGAKILLKSKTNGTETTIFGTSITSVTITGVTGKIKTQSFTYDGTAFLPDGVSVQID